ncbi:MAG: hypothetical protein SGJ10_01065 [Bacteroidota bacterium]|nr:hypothetical protein [Bacteroidota bacterium]
MEYPKQHKEIVNQLMAGKFLLRNEMDFEIIKQNKDFYTSFFKESFNYGLQIESEYAYIISFETKEQLSRDICIMMAVLSYELDKDGKNFMDQLQYAPFEYDQIDKYFENSSYQDLIKANKQLRDSESRRQFLRTMATRNIIEKTGEQQFMFTPALKVFIDFAVDFATGKLEQASVSLDNDTDSYADGEEEE